MENENDNIIKLVTSDNKEFDIPKNIAMKSSLLATLISDFSGEDKIPISKVNSQTMEKIINYLNHYEKSEPKPIPKPLVNSNIETILDKWDFEFINPLTIEECVDLVNAANLMNIESLLQLGAAKIASLYIDKDVSEIQKDLNIECDMKEEEMKEYEECAKYLE